MSTLTIEYDCGQTIHIPTTLRSDQTLLANAALGDTLIGLADAQHDATCQTCPEARSAQPDLEGTR